MVDTSLSETEIVQNAALATTMIWQCGLSYQEEADSALMPVPIAFLVLPICLHRQSLDVVLSTQRRSGLSLFAGKLGKNREELFAVHDRTFAYRALTLESIGLGIRSRLLTVDYPSAKIRSNAFSMPKDVPERVKSLVKGSARLGAWCSRLTVEQVSTTLRVEF